MTMVLATVSPQNRAFLRHLLPYVSRVDEAIILFYIVDIRFFTLYELR